MSKKKRSAPAKAPAGRNGSGTAAAEATSDAGAAPAAANGSQPAVPAQPPRARPAPARPVAGLPGEIGKGDWTAILLALMMFFTPALGVPHEEMLQDTLKSIIVSFVTLGAALILFWRQRNRRDAMRWHFVMWLFIALMLYALGSMIWSHTYLAAVEAIRWFVLAVLMWLTLNTLSRDRMPILAMGIHWGAVAATLWAALQFWIALTYIPQGPNPASTFVNRNFYAEFIACTIPFSMFLVLRSRKAPQIAVYAAGFAFNLVGLMMTGTRSAMVASVVTLVLTVIGLYVFRRGLAAYTWPWRLRVVGVTAFLVFFVGLGMIPTGNPKIGQPGANFNAFQQAVQRSSSLVYADEYTQGSFSVRLIMWSATLRVIQGRPLSGVGAGAWEVDIPLYQKEGSQLETDYYVHNEVLQLVAEYGLVGWAMLLALVAYLMVSTWRTWRLRTRPDMEEEALLRVVALGSLAAFMLVSNAGFPWRLATTGALFALGLGLLAASDARMALRGWTATQRLAWQPTYSQTGAVVTMLCLALAAFITQKAAECEHKIVRATKLALTISQGGDPNNPRWDKTKAEMLKLIKEGTDLNPHYRKITPMVADELARWGDWRNATWIWESVLSSRPYIVAIMANIARGYAQTGQPDKALQYLARAKKIQPNAVSVRSLEVILMARSGREPEGLKLARDALDKGIFDYDLINGAWVLGARAKDIPFAIKALELRAQHWPAQKADSLMRIAGLQLGELKDEAKAIATYRQALESVTPAEQENLRKQIPAQILAKIK